jgi:SHS family lactate transporter-like MFS transporter
VFHWTLWLVSRGESEQDCSPDAARGTCPGFVYQLGNLLASVNTTLEAGIASHFGGNYGLALAVVACSVAIIIAVLTAVDTEAKGIVFAKAKAVVS